jgi:hypothetical protein
MNQGTLVFSQLMQHLPLTTLRRCVARYRGEHKTKAFSCLDQFLCMAFAQLTYRESLRDIVAGPRATQQALSPGHPLERIAQHAGQRQCGPRLAHLRRLRAVPHRHCAQALRRRTVRRGPEGDRLRAGLDDHRSVSVGPSVGTIHVHQGRGQAPGLAHDRRQAVIPDAPPPVAL